MSKWCLLSEAGGTLSGGRSEDSLSVPNLSNSLGHGTVQASRHPGINGLGIRHLPCLL